MIGQITAMTFKALFFCFCGLKIIDWSCSENWKSKSRTAVEREGMRRRGTASDYWEDKDPAVWGLTAPSTSGALHPSLHSSPSSPSNSTETREFPPPHHPPIIHLSLHSSLFSPTNGNNNTKQHNNQQSYVRPFSKLPSKSQLLRMIGLLIRPLKPFPLRERDTSESREECNFQVLVWSSHRVCQRIPYSASQQSRRLLYASIQCRRQSWFCITLDYSDTLRQPANSQ